jgi:hypothetical protein
MMRPPKAAKRDLQHEVLDPCSEVLADPDLLKFCLQQLNASRLVALAGRVGVGTKLGSPFERGRRPVTIQIERDRFVLDYRHAALAARAVNRQWRAAATPIAMNLSMNLQIYIWHATIALFSGFILMKNYPTHTRETLPNGRVVLLENGQVGPSCTLADGIRSMWQRHNVAFGTCVDRVSNHPHQHDAAFYTCAEWLRAHWETGQHCVLDVSRLGGDAAAAARLGVVAWSVFLATQGIKGPLLVLCRRREAKRWINAHARYPNTCVVLLDRPYSVEEMQAKTTHKYTTILATYESVSDDDDWLQQLLAFPCAYQVMDEARLFVSRTQLADLFFPESGIQCSVPTHNHPGGQQRHHAMLDDFSAGGRSGSLRGAEACTIIRARHQKGLEVMYDTLVRSLDAFDLTAAETEQIIVGNVAPLLELCMALPVSA